MNVVEISGTQNILQRSKSYRCKIELMLPEKTTFRSDTIPWERLKMGNVVKTFSFQKKNNIALNIVLHNHLIAEPIMHRA